MDTDILNSITDCKAIVERSGDEPKPCEFWYEILGECRRPAGIDCRHGVRRPQQDFAEQDYNSL